MTEIGDLDWRGIRKLYAIWLSDFEFAWNNRAEDKYQKTRQTLVGVGVMISIQNPKSKIQNRGD
jgi:hypothetical protein